MWGQRCGETPGEAGPAWCDEAWNVGTGVRTGRKPLPQENAVAKCARSLFLLEQRMRALDAGRIRSWRVFFLGGVVREGRVP